MDLLALPAAVARQVLATMGADPQSLPGHPHAGEERSRDRLCSHSIGAALCDQAEGLYVGMGPASHAPTAGGGPAWVPGSDWAPARERALR